MIEPPTRDVIDDARRFTDQDIRNACNLIDALDGDIQAAVYALELAQRMRGLVKESGK
jgi:hypothetical protein